jgi:2-keto-4-pentenoate hydratase/2-oxohepta-3-ene-1,7-dioic acid hydratase in catechol pathway
MERDRMRWATYLSPNDQAEHVGVVHDGAVHGLRGAHALLPLLADAETLRRAGESALADPLEVVPEAAVSFRAPVPAPPSIRDFMAFEEHVVNSMRAMGHEVNPVWYQIPVFYFTNPAAVYGPADPVPVSPGSDAFDYEMEIGAVIGAPGRNITVEDAERHIAGYTILCDWSARDHQRLEMQVGLGPAKGKDTATSFGPLLVTPDELADRRSGKGYDVAAETTVNDKVYSAGNWKAIHWSFAQMISYASRGTQLRTGDVIGSGTIGTGCIVELSRVHGAEAYPWLVPGDVVRMSLDGFGAIESTVAKPEPLNPL